MAKNVMGTMGEVVLDRETLLALRIVEATGLSRSEAIRASILGHAAWLREPSALATEVAGLHASRADRQDMEAVAADMDALRGLW